MSIGLKRTAKISLLSLTLILITSFISIAIVMGVVDFDGPKTIQPGNSSAYSYTVENFKNQRFKITVDYDQTVQSGFELHILLVDRDRWYRLRDNSTLRLDDIPAADYVHNFTMDSLTFTDPQKEEPNYQYQEVIPDWDAWTFVFLSYNSGDMLINIKIEHQHVLWWLWIVLPVIVVVGLATYAIVENVTKYERAKMYSEKALKKLGAKSEAERKRAAYWLISNGTSEDLELLLSLINDENPHFRESAAMAIGGIAKRLDDDRPVKKLIETYEKENNLIVKESLVSAMCDIASEESLEILEENLLKEHNEKLRFKIAEALEDIAAEESIEFLVEILTKENTDTLKMACRRALDKIAKNQGTTADELIKKHSK